jgi:hypothetical protein
MKLTFARSARTTEVSLVLKGHDFSRAVKRTKQAAALAAEEMRADSRAFPQGLKPRISFTRLAARLKSCPFRAAAFASAILIGLSALSCAAQVATSTPLAQPQATPATPPHQGRIIFSRSTGEDGQTTTQSAEPIPQQAQLAPAQVVERQAVTFTSFDLDLRLYLAAQQIAVRALITVRNDGKSPLSRIPLQISSSLNWEEIRLDSPHGQLQNTAFQVATVNSDADHTGQLHEALIPLLQPLLPGQSLRLDVTYSGPIAASAQRLLAIGAPDSAAQHSDWDQVGVDFTGLRGFGNVVWYPVSSEPVFLGDGAQLFDEMGRQKLRMAGARFRLRLTDEFPHGQAPTVALINGHSVPLAVTESGASLDQSQEVASVATASFDSPALGFEAPSLFVAIRAPHPGPNLTAWTLSEDNVAVEFWTTAATAVTPFLQGWLGRQPRTQLTLLDLPDSADAPFESAALLAAPLREPAPGAKPDRMEEALVHSLTRAWITPASFASPSPAWLNEGVATFMGALWVEKQQGRAAALRLLEAGRAALALAAPASPGESAGQPLAQAISPVYYRTKAAYVLWMLRDLAGEQALSAALRAYYSTAAQAAVPVQDVALVKNEVSDRNHFEKLLEAAGNHLDLGWFFADWVDADKGLPDLSIAGVYPSAEQAGNWLVAVDLANAGYAAAEIPVTVRAGSGSGATSITRRVLVPARGRMTERILILGKPTEVQANDGTVPETQASVHVTRLDEPATAPASSSQSNPAPQ